jgi:predicted RNA-binding protein YlqC (UPF0109 family)
MGSTTSMEDLIVAIAKSLVDSPDQVEVRVQAGDQAYVFELIVAKEDLGKVIGKNGRIAKSIRTILNAVSGRLNKRAILEIID